MPVLDVYETFIPPATGLETRFVNMGKRGPKPTPTPLLKMRGSWRGETRSNEPTVAPAIPVCPKWVRASAVPYWPEVAEMLFGLGLIAPAYTVALGLLVDSLADWIRVSTEAEDADLLVDGSTGNKVANPLFALKAQAWDRTLKALREFGLTPSAISSVKAVKEDAPQGPQNSIKLA